MYSIGVHLSGYVLNWCTTGEKLLPDYNLEEFKAGHVRIRNNIFTLWNLPHRPENGDYVFLKF